MSAEIKGDGKSRCSWIPDNLLARSEQERKAEERVRERAQRVIDESWRAYLDGEIEFEDLCEYVRGAILKLPQGGIPSRSQLLGQVVFSAMQSHRWPIKRRRRWAKWIGQAIRELLPAVKRREGLKRGRDAIKAGISAEGRIAEILSEAGIEGLTANTVEKLASK